MYKKFLLYWLPVIFVAIIILFFSTTPQIQQESQAKSNNFFSKMDHCIAYFTLTALLLRANIKTKKFNFPYLTSIIITILYGLLIEIIQYFIPTRNCSLMDITLNSLGSFTILFFNIKKWQRKKH